MTTVNDPSLPSARGKNMTPEDLQEIIRSGGVDSAQTTTVRIGPGGSYRICSDWYDRFGQPLQVSGVHTGRKLKNVVGVLPGPVFVVYSRPGPGADVVLVRYDCPAGGIDFVATHHASFADAGRYALAESRRVIDGEGPATLDDPSFHPSCDQYRAGTERTAAFRGTSTWKLMPKWFRDAIGMVGWHTIDMADVACQARSALGSDVRLNWPLNDEGLKTFELRTRGGQTYEVWPFTGVWKIRRKGEDSGSAHAHLPDAFRWAVDDSTPPVAPEPVAVPNETPWGVLAANVERICERSGVSTDPLTGIVSEHPVAWNLLLDLGRSGAINLTQEGLDSIASYLDATVDELLAPQAAATDIGLDHPGDVLAENLRRAIENSPWSLGWLAQQISATEDEIEALMVGGDCAISSGLLGRLADALKTTTAELFTPRERPA